MVYSTLSDLGYVQCMQPASLSSPTPLGRCPGIFFYILNHYCKTPEHNCKPPKLQFTEQWPEIADRGILRVLSFKMEPIAGGSELGGVKEIEHCCVTL